MQCDKRIDETAHLGFLQNMLMMCLFCLQLTGEKNVYRVKKPSGPKDHVSLTVWGALAPLLSQSEAELQGAGAVLTCSEAWLGVVNVLQQIVCMKKVVTRQSGSKSYKEHRLVIIDTIKQPTNLSRADGSFFLFIISVLTLSFMTQFGPN